MKSDSSLVVYKIGRYFFVARNALEIRGVQPDEIWFFGTPQSDDDKAIDEVARAAAHTHGVVWHEIPQ